jgi:5-methylcytosine-specific restriction enzyme A
MPKAAPRPCTHPGCKAYATNGGRCDDHKRVGWNEWQAAKGNNVQRGYGKAWRALRAEAMRRDSHLCQCCLEEGVYTPATDVDHITPKALGGTDELGNLQALCRPCHREKTAQEATQGRRGAKKVET